jgi:putative endopeptidase
MKNIYKITALIIVLLVCSRAYSQTLSSNKGRGIILENMDTSVDPSVDFYAYANGGWIKTNPVPPEYSRWGSFDQIAEDNRVILKAILEEAAAMNNAPRGSNMQKIGDLFYSAMNEEAIERAGYSPLQKDFDMIGGIQNKEDLLKTMSYMHSFWVSSAFGMWSGQDDKSSQDVVLNINQGGLSLPDRDYYFREDSKSKRIREEYIKYITQMFELLGDDPATAKANADIVFKLETRYAAASKTRVEMRDPEKTYNKFTIAELRSLMPDFNWDVYLAGVGVDKSSLSKGIIVSNPSFLVEINKMLTDVPMDEWKTLLRWKLINSAADNLSSPFRNANFHFYETVLSGVTEQEPRWKIAQGKVSGAMGEALGQLFIEKKFSPESKERVLKMVGNIREALGERIKQLDWMSDATKQRALEKLGTFKVKIGYPDKWRDFSALELDRGILADNMRRSAMFSFRRNMNKLGKPVEDEWFMNPQTVNAYYSSSKNEIVFPAGILQPPFFDPEADDAVNYGGIGAVIGHEITHGFDDQGRKYDAYGNMTDWWTEQDAKNYTERANKIAEQYSGYNAIDSFYVNGDLTLGENIADLGGLTISYLAFKKTPQFQSGGKIDGFTPTQRFFIGYAQIWRQNIRDDELMMRLTTDVHSPGKFRVIGPLSNMDEFEEAFGLKEGSPMMRQKNERVRIW